MSDRIARIVAGEMWDLIQTCYLGPKLKRELPRLASSGDCDGILKRCRALPPAVGREIRAGGKKSIEDVLPELERLQRVHEGVQRALSGEL